MNNIIEDYYERFNQVYLRIKIDQTMYEGNQTLQGLFIKIWQYIENHEYKDVLKDRMIEELIDMSDTCTTGHISRLVNVLSGFGFTLNIGWKKQIQANLIARLTKRIQNIGDEKQMSQLLDELSWSTNFEERKMFNSFFRDNLNPIRDELYKEFVVDGNHTTHDEFENYFRDAILFFEKQ